MSKEIITPILDVHRMKISVRENKKEKLTITDLVNDSHNIAYNNGFWEDYDDARNNNWRFNNMLNTKLLLVVSEIIEAQEVIREKDINKEDNLDKFAEELADAVIRIADLAGAMSIDLEGAIIKKTEKNRTRPRKHGKQF